MKTIYGLLLTKGVELGKGLIVSNGHLQWPENVLSYLENKFHLLPKDMACLQCTRYQRVLDGTPISFIRIFDWVKAYKQGVIIKQYHHLDAHPELMLFEGHILKNGIVYLKKKEFMAAG